MNAARVPGLVMIVSLLVGGLVLDQTRTDVERSVEDVLLPGSVVAEPGARSSTWFCAAGTAAEGGLADALVVLANTTTTATNAVVSVFPGGPNPQPDQEITEIVLPIEPLSQVDLRLADLAPGSPVVSIAVEVAGGGVLVDKIASGASGVARSACATEASTEWVVTSGSTTPGARLELVVLNPFPGDAVIDVDFITEAGVRSPEDLVALHVPARSSRLIEVGDVVAAAETVTSFVRARSGRVIVEAIQSFDGSDAPLGLGVSSGIPTSAAVWTFPGISPAIGPARLVVVNPGEALVRANVEVYPAGGERFVEPLELTIRPGQHAVLDLVDEGRFAGIDSFTLLVRSLDGARVIAGIEQRPTVEAPDPLAEFVEQVEAPTTGFATSAGQAMMSTELFSTVELAPDDSRSALHVFNPAADSFVTIEVTIAEGGASRTQNFEVGPQRTLRIALTDLATGRFSLHLRASAPIVAARELTGLSSRSWSPLTPLG